MSGLNGLQSQRPTAGSVQRPLPGSKQEADNVGFQALRFFLAGIPLLAALLAGCGGRVPEPAAPEGVVLARVGGEVITAEEFRLSYAFGHGHLRRGENPRRAYLGYMIDELLLAQEAERLGLDTARAVVHALHTLREELLIERVFETRVLDHIETPDEEIRAEVNRNAVRFRFRFLPALSERHAAGLGRHVAAKGYAAVRDSLLRANRELQPVAEAFESPALRADEIEPDLLAVLQDLPAGVPSPPVFWQNAWYVFEVTSVERTRLSEADYQAQASTVRKQLYNRKAMAEGTAFVAATMEPLNVVTKRRGFEVLAEALWPWYAEEPPFRNLLFQIETERRDAGYTRHLIRHYDEPLVAFGGEAWTIRDFLKHFTPGRYVLRADDPAAFKARLADVVALVVRDAVLLEMARRAALDRDPAVQRTLHRWRSKWLFEELARRNAEPNKSEENALRVFYARRTADSAQPFVPFDELGPEQKDRLRTKLRQDRLRDLAAGAAGRYAVEIEEAVLDTMRLDGSAANPYMTVHLFKSNADKMPFPIPDPVWRVE